jgi:hypothetical protein
MQIGLDPEIREKISISELERHILSVVKEAKNNKRFFEYPTHPKNLLSAICSDLDGSRSTIEESFDLKFSESLALLKRRCLLMDSIDKYPCICLSSVGEKSNFHEGIFILVDSAQEIVDFLKKEVPNLDSVVEQYYLESLRACQEGLYISSVICLGSASERAIDCLGEAVVKYDSQYTKEIENKYTSNVAEYIANSIKQIFSSIKDTDGHFIEELKNKLKGISVIYRLNRNDAGHPAQISMDIGRDEQECYLNQFRRYVVTIFKAIEIMDNNHHIPNK